jgi:hypothetical protein
MRLKLILSSFVVASSIAVASCSQDSQTPTVDTRARQDVRQTRASASEVKGAKEKGRRIGQQHTEAMEFVRKRIMVASHQKGAPLTKDEATAVLHGALNDYLTSNGYRGLGRSEVDAWRNRIAKHGNNAPALLTEFTATSDGVQLSAEAHAYLNQMVYLADIAGAYGYEWLESELWGIENSASGTLSGRDLEVVFEVSSVTLSSAAYWTSFADEWYRMCGSQLVCDGSSGEGAVIQGLSLGWKVLGSDVVGAIGGALVPAPGAVAAGAFVASACAIIGAL